MNAPASDMASIEGGWIQVIGLFVARVGIGLEQIRTREDGQAMVEYALLLFLIAVVSVVILGLLGTKVSEVFNQVVHDI
jgi:Flp pilus assembly pilin Flp